MPSFYNFLLQMCKELIWCIFELPNAAYLCGNTWRYLLCYCSVVIPLHSWVLHRWSAQVLRSSYICFLLSCQNIFINFGIYTYLSYISMHMCFVCMCLSFHRHSAFAGIQACWQLLWVFYSFYWLAFLTLELWMLRMYLNISLLTLMTILFSPRKNVRLARS